MLGTSFVESTKYFSLIAAVCLVSLSPGCGDGGMPGSGGGRGGAGAGGARPIGGAGGEGCGNGLLEFPEDCDDGNQQRGDGCHQCVSEQVCVATHNGGRPASFGSVRIDSELNPIARPTLTLPTGLDDGAPESHDEHSFGRLTGCGREHAYAVLADDESIAQLTFDDLGNPQFVEVIEVTDVVAVACAPSIDVVYAVSSSPAGGYLVVRSFLVDEDGQLTESDQLTVTYFGFLNYFYERARLAVHPISGELWLTGYFRDRFGGVVDQSSTARIAADTSGVLTLAEQARDIGTGAGGLSFRFRADGRLLAATGVDGDCVAVWPVADNGILPAFRDRSYSCGYVWDAGDVAWFRSSERFHVLLQEELRVGEPDGRALSGDSGLLLTTRARLMESVYDSSGLVVVRQFSGHLHVYRVGEEPTDLALVDDLDIAERGIRSLTQIPCIP